MDRLLYVAMTGAKQLMQAQTLVANNLANVNTTAFRADLARFEAAPVAGAGYPSRINTVASGLGFDRSQGTLEATGNPLDVAIDGPGWLAVQAKDGSEAYTRGGSLNVNGLGLLEDERGNLVLGDNGPVAIPPNTSVTIAADGSVSIVPQGQGPETLAQIARLKLVNPDASKLEKRTDGLVRIAGGGKPPVADANVRVAPRFIEHSNVNMAGSMVDMIEYARQFEVAVRMMHVADENESRAASLASLS
ncbi:MAG TPA: flagellar basal-body rod protein FlgF [Gammaproteobacteria bacterium]|nr:flagellar basal-body rod protein FlgF [Gammaproteobacteria bacterium]